MSNKEWRKYWINYDNLTVTLKSIKTSCEKINFIENECSNFYELHDMSNVNKFLLFFSFDVTQAFVSIGAYSYILAWKRQKRVHIYWKFEAKCGI